jgi:hypothetical protein
MRKDLSNEDGKWLVFENWADKLSKKDKHNK